MWTFILSEVRSWRRTTLPHCPCRLRTLAADSSVWAGILRMSALRTENRVRSSVTIGDHMACRSSSILVQIHVTLEPRQALWRHAHDGLLSRHKALTTCTELPHTPYSPCIILPATIVVAATVQPQWGQRCTCTRKVMTHR